VNILFISKVYFVIDYVILCTRICWFWFSLL